MGVPQITRTPPPPLPGQPEPASLELSVHLKPRGSGSYWLLYTQNSVANKRPLPWDPSPLRTVAQATCQAIPHSSPELDSTTPLSQSPSHIHLCARECVNQRAAGHLPPLLSKRCFEAVSLISWGTPATFLPQSPSTGVTNTTVPRS